MNFKKCKNCGWPEIVHPCYKRGTEGCEEFVGVPRGPFTDKELAEHFAKSQSPSRLE